MYDYIRVFTDEAAAVEASPDLGHYNHEGQWRWSKLGLLVGITVTRADGTDVPGFALLMSRPEPDEALAAMCELELSRDLARGSDTLSQCVTRSKPGFMATHNVVSFSPVMMGSRYPARPQS